MLLALPGIVSEYHNTQKNVLHLPLMYRRTSPLAWLLLRDPGRKPALFRCAGFFLCFLYASARTACMVMVVMVVVLDGSWMLCTCHFICLSCIPILVKVSARLSQ